MPRLRGGRARVPLAAPAAAPPVLAAVLAAVVALLLAGCSGGAPAPDPRAAPGPGAATAAPPAVDATAAPSTPAPTSAASTSAAPSTPAPDPVEVAVERALAATGARARVEQLVVAGVDVDDRAAGEELLRSRAVGGVFLHGRSSAAATALADQTAAWRAVAADRGAVAPWVAVDQEGGAVQTLSGPGFTALPSARRQAERGPASVEDAARRTGRELAAAGVDLDLAPVADAVPAGTASSNAPIGRYGRQYGATAAAAEPMAAAVVRGLAGEGVVAAVKHYPGLGRVAGNTDTTAGVTDTTTGPDDPQVTAFGALAALPEQPFVMVSSATYSRIDPGERAVFSPVVVQQLLRERMGFDGVVISDDLAAARAVADVPVGDRAVRFLAAGGTLVLVVDAAAVPAVVDAVSARAASDPAFAAQVDAAVRVALRAKARAGLLPVAAGAPSGAPAGGAAPPAASTRASDGASTTAG